MNKPNLKDHQFQNPSYYAILQSSEENQTIQSARREKIAAAKAYVKQGDRSDAASTPMQNPYGNYHPFNEHSARNSMRKISKQTSKESLSQNQNQN